MDGKLFDLAEEYDSQLQKELDLSGYSPESFGRGRSADLRNRPPTSKHPLRILDFGCGIGRAAQHLTEAFPHAQIVGVDTSKAAIAYTQAHYGSSSRDFHALEELPGLGHFHLCYVNGVSHHIRPEDRLAAPLMIRDTLKPGGWLALFENNPWNPGTCLVMSRIPFDRDAVPLSPPSVRRLLLTARFRLEQAIRYLFYFPRALAGPWPVLMPFGAQYYALARRVE
jgi:SAM-dependent methyltransferase